ncbi:uncharacterized protein [Elaeis guineensis]|uniref:Uncharacterized protein LOC105048940 isoform X2 n=1 Tax=Elaeis guineensis var. tenera TaxID=51953 RepID=A0A6I9RHV7_ELAGV|nr:uncharacterized protein LOC105048940 isoform X2 [Elaeis guineensis]
MVLNVDLNVPPLESWMPNGASGSAHPWESQGVTVPVNPQCGHSTRGQQGAVLTSNNGLRSSPIDVEALEDDVEMFSSLRGFPQTRNRARRNQPVTVVLDEDLETRPRHSGVTIGEPVTTLSLNTHNRRERIPTNMTIINCDLDLDPEEESDAKVRMITSIESSCCYKMISIWHFECMYVHVMKAYQHLKSLGDTMELSNVNGNPWFYVYFSLVI